APSAGLPEDAADARRRRMRDRRRRDRLEAVRHGRRSLLGGFQRQPGRVGPGQQAKWDEARPQPPGDVQGRRRTEEEPLPVLRPEMLEPDLPAGSGKADLAAVVVTAEHEVVRAFGQSVDDVRKVTEEDAETSIGVGPLGRARAPLEVRGRVDARDLHRYAPKLDRPRLVTQENSPGAAVDV